MKRLLAAVAVSALIAPAGRSSAQGVAGGKHTGAHPADVNLPATILHLEEQRIAAMVSKDVATLDTLLADDLSYTHSGGTSDTKASFIALIRDRGRYQGIDYSNPEVVRLAASTAVAVRGRAQIRLEGVAPYTVLFLDVWAMRDGRWKMVAWQATRIP
jgi:hypothetical protein